MTPPLTPVQAEQLYRAFLLDALYDYRVLDGINIDVQLSLNKVGDIPLMRELLDHAEAPLPNADGTISLRDLTMTGQRGSTLGERLENACLDAFAEGVRVLCIVGSDHPTLPVRFVRDAFTLLEQHDVVLGPAHDGGYYLVGLSKPSAEIFREMPYSTPLLFKETLRRAADKGLRVGLLPLWYDVDDRESLDRLNRDRELLRSGSRTRAVLDDLF